MIDHITERFNSMGRFLTTLLSIVFIFLFHASIAQNPIITSVTPDHGIPGKSVRILGTGFSTASNFVIWQTRVHIGGIEVFNDDSFFTDDKALDITIPSGFLGPIDIVVTMWDVDFGDNILLATSNQINITVLDPDHVTSFIANSETIIGLTSSQSVTAADIDGDGDLDLVSGNGLTNVSWWRNTDGLGTFSGELIISSLAMGIRSVAVGDLDGDGDIDVLSASELDNTIAWYKNDGLGNFDPQIIISILTSAARSVAVADLDNDGDLDVLSASEFDDKIAWYKNDGFGGFGGQNIISSVANGAFWVSTGDLNNDGNMDVLSASFLDDKITWYLNNGVGGFVEQTAISIFTDGARSVNVADIDGDGDLDVVTAGEIDRQVAWHRNDGLGNFSAEIVIFTNLNLISYAGTADMDNDGDLDVLSASELDGKIVWYENTNGLGAFSGEIIITNVGGVGANFALPMDYDGDGDLDIIGSFEATSDKISSYENLNAQTDILTFSIPEQLTPAIIDDVNHTINIGIKSGSDITSLVPDFTLSFGAAAVVNAVPIASGLSAVNFTSPVIYVVTAEDGAIQNWTVTASIVTNTATDIESFSFAEEVGLFSPDPK